MSSPKIRPRAACEGPVAAISLSVHGSQTDGALERFNNAGPRFSWKRLVAQTFRDEARNGMNYKLRAFARS